MIVGKLMQSVLGIRIVLGLLAASAIGLGVITWMWRNAEQQAANAQAAAQTAREVAEANAQEAKAAQQRADRLDKTLADLRAAERNRRERLQQQLGSLRDALADSDCAHRAVPADARSRLFGAAPDGDSDTDGSSDGAGQSN